MTLCEGSETLLEYCLTAAEGNMKKNTYLLVASFCFLFSLPAFSANIKAIKGRKVLIELKGDTVNVGDVYRVKNSSGQKTGLVKISRVAPKVAEAQLKGKAKKGDSVDVSEKIASSKAKSSKKSNSQGSKSTEYGKSSFYIGGILGFSSSKAEIALPNQTANVNLSGTGFSVKALADFQVYEFLWFRGLAGLEQFNVGGENAPDCNNSECTAEVNYLSLDLWGRAVLGTGSFRPWAGLGFTVLFPASKESTALDEDKIAATSTFNIGGGFDYFLSPTTFVPVQVDFALFPKSDDVVASSIAARVGFGTSF